MEKSSDLTKDRAGELEVSFDDLTIWYSLILLTEHCIAESALTMIVLDVHDGASDLVKLWAVGGSSISGRTGRILSAVGFDRGLLDLPVACMHLQSTAGGEDLRAAGAGLAVGRVFDSVHPCFTRSRFPRSTAFG